MMRLQLNRTSRAAEAALFLTILLLLLTLLLSVGGAYGRYSTVLNADAVFSPQPKAKVYLFSGRGEDGIGNAALEWVSDTDQFTQSLNICMSNSDAEGNSPAAEDTAVHLRLFLSETVGLESDERDPLGNLEIILQIDGEAVQYIATGEYLRSGTSLYLKKGAGWIYCFEDENGNELTHILKGGEQSDVNLTLTVQDTNVKISDFELQIEQEEPVGYCGTSV